MSSSVQPDATTKGVKTTAAEIAVTEEPSRQDPPTPQPSQLPHQPPQSPQAQAQSMAQELLDAEAFGTRGEGWVAAQFLAFALIVAPPSALTSTVDSLAYLSMLVGGLLVGFSVWDLGKNLTPLPAPRKEHSLVKSGVYGYARHPMYGGVLLLTLGLSTVTHSEARLAAVALLWWILENKVKLEEGALRELYPEYDEYKTKVKKFIPFIY